ncbi:MAG: helix-turn-helix domain-containing protein [Runella sp.]
MKPQLEKLLPLATESFSVKHLYQPYFDAPWHYHPEYELTFIVRGSGQRFVADNVASFAEGDLVLLGSNLPHFWRCSSDFYLYPPIHTAEAVVVQFGEDFVKNFLAKAPEFSSIIQLLHRSAWGIVFEDSTTQRLRGSFLELSSLNGSAKLLALLTILSVLAEAPNIQLLASSTYRLAPDEAENERMKRVLDFTLTHFQQEISLEAIANVAHLTVPAFCRYFKKRTQKTYVEFLTMIRLNHACKLLTHSEMSVAQIGLESGFQHLPHFHRLFKQYTSRSPLQYRLQHQVRH